MKILELKGIIKFDIIEILINIHLPISFLGLIANLMNVFVFSSKTFKENIFHYLLIHSISETFYFVFKIIVLFPYYSSLYSNSLSSSYLSKSIVLYIEFYVSPMFALFSLIIEIIITIHRLMVVTNSNFRVRVSSFLLTGLIFLIVSLIYSPKFIFNKIIKMKSNETGYTIAKTDYGLKYDGYYSFIVNVFRGPFCVSVLTILNLITLFKFKKQMKNKKKIKRISFDQSNSLMTIF
jgi:hypothetical protein